MPQKVINFSELLMRAPRFNLPLQMHGATMAMSNPGVALEGTSLGVKRSSVITANRMVKLCHTVAGGRALGTHLTVSSRVVSYGRLVGSFSLSRSSMSITIASAISPARVGLFILPNGLSFRLRASLGGMIFRGIRFRSIYKGVSLGGHALCLEGLRVHTLSTSVGTIVMCHTSSIEKKCANFSFGVESVGVTGLMSFVPSVSAVMPVLESFRKEIRFSITTRTHLSSGVGVHVPALHSTVCVGKSDLILVSNRAFTRVSGVLVFGGGGGGMFSDVSIGMIIGSNDILICPFRISVSHCGTTVKKRRKLSVGFGCRVSVLGSPLPFGTKIGVSNGLSGVGVHMNGTGCGSSIAPTTVRGMSDAHVSLKEHVIRQFRHVMKME